MVRKESANTFTGDYWVRQIQNACKVWPKGKQPDLSSKPAVFRGPVLLVSGGLDPVTPPKWGDEVAKWLPNSRHFVIPNGSHSFNRLVGCVDVVIADFIAKRLDRLSGFQLRLENCASSICSSISLDSFQHEDSRALSSQIISNYL